MRRRLQRRPFWKGAAAAPQGEYRLAHPDGVGVDGHGFLLLSAGVTKLRVSGLHWATGDNMVFTLRAHEVNQSDPVLHIGPWIADHAWMAQTLAATTLVLETGFISALFSERARSFVVPGMFLGHVFIAIVMGVVFWQFMFTYIFWLPWERILRRNACT